MNGNRARLITRPFLPSIAFALIAGLPLFARQSLPSNPSSWPKDSHQGFTVAVRPYSDAAVAKKTFGKADPYKAGILAVTVYFRNNLKDPVHVDLSTIRLDVDAPNGRHFRLPRLRVAQAAAQIAHPKGISALRPPRIPLPFPIHDGKERGIEKKLRPLSLQSDVVPAGGSIQGLLFFDMSGHFELVAHSSLYIPDVKSVASQNSLIYFSVPLSSAP